LRGTGHRLGLLTNGQQFRLVYAGLDFESWCEWESDRWFDEGEGTEELCGLRQLLSPASLGPTKTGVSGLLDAVEESRKRQADLSSVLRENVRQAVELLLDEVSTANRTNASLFTALKQHDGDRTLTDAEAHEALLQATVRIVMRLVVCLFAESRQLLPINDPIFAQSYGVRSLYELLDEVIRNEGGTYALFNRQTAWPRLMALFRLIHGGSSHGAFPLRPYGGVLFRPGDNASTDPVARALHILEHEVSVADDKIFHVLRKLLRGPLPVIKGTQKTFVDGPVDYTDLRTEFIGLIYEGLLDYRLKRTDEQFGPQVFLNLGREPVLPLKRLEDMLADDPRGLKDLLTTLRKEKVTASAAEKEEEQEEADEETQDGEAADEPATEDPAVELDAAAEQVQRTGDYLDAAEAAKQWAREAIVLASLFRKQRKKESDSQYQLELEAEANRLIRRVVANGEFYLVRAGNTRKGTGTFYTRPQLAVPTTHRTLQPLCYDKADDGTLTPKVPEAILGLKVCDPACGSASFLVAALHYLTDALYKSLALHRKLDDPAQSKRLTLPYGRQRTNGETDQLVPFPSNDPQRGHTFEDRIKALLRRHVVERCIYGVDLNPLAVEFARVSLWVETLDAELPFSFLDHKIKVGNALVGCWLDQVEDYPIKAWEREGGDGPKGNSTFIIKWFLKGIDTDKIDMSVITSRGLQTGTKNDGVVKQEMREFLREIADRQAGQKINLPGLEESVIQVAENARVDYERLHDLPIANNDQREVWFRDHFEQSESFLALRRAMDEWCAIWFWPIDNDGIANVDTPHVFHHMREEKDAIVARLASELRFFHWEIEFPDVFTPTRNGFDCVIGNPPWDVMKPNSQEFFTEYDPLYRTYDKQTALRKQKGLFESMAGLTAAWNNYNGQFKSLGNWARNVAEPFDTKLALGKEGDRLAQQWAKHRKDRTGYADVQHPFRLQGSADLNSYKMFAEFFWRLLRPNGRLGVILPTGIYSDFGTKDLREELLFRGRLELLYAFQNEKKIFTAADHRFKQVALFVTKGGKTKEFRSRFRMGVGDSPHAQEIPDDILGSDAAAMLLTPDDVRANSPKTLSLVELRTPRDAEIFAKIYAHSFRIGDNEPGWEVTYTREFDMTNDSKHFPPLERWEVQGYKPDVFGRWIGPAGDVALPFYQGRMVQQFDFSSSRYISGKGPSAIWEKLSFDHKRWEPSNLMAANYFAKNCATSGALRLVFRDVARNTDTRTMLASCIVSNPCSNKVPLLILKDFRHHLAFVAFLNSLVFDYALRSRLSGATLNWFIVADCPIAIIQLLQCVDSLHAKAARLSFLNRRFAPEWLKLKSLLSELGEREWKHWWAVTEADRLRLRVEVDALCADLYGLNPDDFDWIVRDDPTDPKGFYRVDRDFPFRERLTGLAAAAFRTLKEGRWTAETGAALSNDEFFDLLGIPELTNADAAHAKGLPGPMILKRDGCHEWRPENFTKDDPRHGWTWEDCHNDAVSLLGSEEAVELYLKDKPAESQAEESTSTAPTQNGPKDLFGDPVPVKPKQGKMF
jgi:hypothetical protein